MKSLINFTKLLTLLYFISSANNAKAIVVEIENNFSQEQQGAMLEISDIEGQRIKPNLKFYILPDENKLISKRPITGFTISRVFGGYKEKYKITCDAKAAKKVKVTLSFEDISRNNLPDACSIEQRGRWSAESGNVWDKKPIKQVNYLRSDDNQDYFIIN